MCNRYRGDNVVLERPWSRLGERHMKSLYDVGDAVWVKEAHCNAFVVQVELPRNKTMRQEPQYVLAQSREQRAFRKMGKCSWYEDSELSVSP